MIEDFDFIVVGAGMAGASVAAELAAGHRVVLLEQEERPGYHTTGRSAALHSEIYGNAVIRALTRASRSFLLSADGGDSAFATPRGCLHIASAEQIARLEVFASVPDVQNATSWLSAHQARELNPLLRADYVCAAVSEHNAYDVDVDALHQFFLRALKVAGGELICSQALAGLERSAGKWTVAAGTRRLAAPVLVNAAGAWGDVVADLAGVAPIDLQAKRRTALLVDAPDGAPVAHLPAVIDIDEQFYFKPDAGKILMSPADETPSIPCDAYPDDFDVALAVERVQAAADIPVTRAPRSWAGLRTFAPDRAPVVGYDDAVPGFFWLVGQGGYGIQTAPALARVAAALALDRPVPSDIIDEGLDVHALALLRLRARAIETSSPA